MKPKIHELYFQGFHNLFERDHGITMWSKLKGFTQLSGFEHVYAHSSEFMNFLYAKENNDYDKAFELAKESTADYVYYYFKYLFTKITNSINNLTGGSIGFHYETLSKTHPRIPLDDPRSDNQIIMDLIKDFDYEEIYHAITEYSNNKESFLFILSVLFINDKFCGNGYQKFCKLLKEQIKDAYDTKLRYYKFIEENTIIQNYNSVLCCIVGSVIIKLREDLYKNYFYIESEINHLYSHNFECHADEVFLKGSNKFSIVN
jgi:hypothetical protein